LYIEDKDRKNKNNKNNRVELQNITLLYIQERDNNNFVYIFFIAIDKEENNK